MDIQFTTSQLITQSECVSCFVREKVIRCTPCFNTILNDVSITQVRISPDLKSAVEAKQTAQKEVQHAALILDKKNHSRKLINYCSCSK